MQTGHDSLVLTTVPKFFSKKSKDSPAKSPKVVEQFKFFETIVFRQFVPLNTLNAVVNKLTNNLCLRVRNCLCQSPQTRKKRFISKRNCFSFRIFLWTRRLQFSLSCRKPFATFSKKFCSSSELRKKSIFSKRKFFRKHALLDNWNAVLTICQNFPTKNPKTLA